MKRETDAQYFARREEQELLLAISAANEVERRAHFALANAYRAKLDALEQAASGGLGEGRAGRLTARAATAGAFGDHATR